MTEHIHTESGLCCCGALALEPDEQCPVHGHPWPPRCTVCGQMLPWQRESAAVNYRKKPVVVEARRLQPDNLDSVATWCGGTVTGSLYDLMATWLAIPTLEGTMYAYPGDWIIKGVAGEFYPIKNEIFRDTYDEVDDSQKAMSGNPKDHSSDGTS